jgi:hypothetical protein
MQTPIRHGCKFIAEEPSSRLPKSAAFFAVLLVVLVWAVQLDAQSAAPADVVYARPGQLIDAGEFRLNLYCMGSGSPTVVFDSDWGDWAPAWSKVQATDRKVDARLQL